MCFSLIEGRSIKTRKENKCPFCNEVIQGDLRGTDHAVLSFLKREEETLKVLPEEKKKLFAFSSIYLPSLHKFMK